MGIPLRVLIVEDSADDAELVLHQLRRAGYDPIAERVQTAEAMRTALERQPWDLVVSDYTMPQFDAPTALSLLNQSGRDVPFIVVSGSIGEDLAVTMMKTGAHDYVLKQNLSRFVSAVQRELREAENRRQQSLTAEANQRLQLERDDLLERLKEENEDLAALTRVTANAISTLDLDELLRVLLGRVVEVMRADTATILLAEGAELRVRASAGAVNLTDSTHVIHVGAGFAGSIAERLKPVYIEDAAVDPLVTDPLIRKRGIRSMLGVPLKRNGRLIGVLHADWLNVRPCRDREVHLLEITAERCAAAIQNAQLYQEAKRVTEALTESEARLRMVTRATNDVIWDWDRRTNAVLWNEAYQTVFGYPPAETDPTRDSWTRLIHPEDLDRVLNGVRTSIESDGQSWSDEYRFRRRDGTYAEIFDRGYIIRDAQGKPMRMIGAMQDITARKEAEEATQTSLLEKEALLKEVHHRVKNNLQVITSLLRLETSRGADASTKSVLRDMQGRIQSMALLHETLYRSGTFASVDLGIYLDQLAAQSFRTLNASTGAIRLNLDLASVQAQIDQAIPCGLLLNELISNCLKHGFPNDRTGGIRVELQPVDGGPQIRLRVSDTGVGLPADFESRRGQSLGLQLVSDLTRQLGGRLEVGPGPGAVFTIIFSVDGPKASTTGPIHRPPPE